MQILLPFFTLILTLSACSKVLTDGNPATDASGPSCNVTVRSTVPTNGATDHYHRSPIVFQLSAPDDTAVVVSDIVGESSWSEDGTQLTFTPDEPLLPDTAYSIGLDYCHGTPEITFSTSVLGLPVDADLDLEGMSYTLDFRSGEYILGANAGELLNALFTREVLFQLMNVEEDQLDARAAISERDIDSPRQDLCARTLDLEGIDISQSPYFESQFDDIWFGMQGGLLYAPRFEVSGSIAPDAQSIGGIQFEAVMGMAQVAELLPDWGDLDSICDIAENLGIACEPCPDDAESSCVTVAAEKMRADAVDVELEIVTEAGGAGCDD